VFVSPSQYIDPRDEPWCDETDDIWGWMKEIWMINVATISVPDTEANRIKEYREITKVSEQQYSVYSFRGKFHCSSGGSGIANRIMVTDQAHREY
jgi:hypothetical protein